MSEFKQFSAATRLYSEYVEVVDEMQRLYLDEISSFLDAVLARMQMNNSGGQIEDEVTKEYRSWWIEDKETNEDDEVPYIWMERKNNQIVKPGILTVIADIDEATDAEKRQISACKSSLNLPPYCKLFERRLFGVSITYGDKEPVEAVSEPILSILTVLHNVEKKVFAVRETNSKKSKQKIVRR